MTRNVLIAMVCTIAVAHGQIPLADHVLDIVTYDLSLQETSGTTILPSHSVSTNGSVSPLAGTIRVTLLSLQGDQFQWGDTCIYEVLIENTGSEPVLLPWSPDAGLFPISTRRGLPGYRHGVIALEVRDQRNSRVLAKLKVQTLFGSEAVVGSLQVLAPRQKALFRVPGEWQATAAEIAEVTKYEPAGSVRVGATFDLFGGLVHVRSVNDVAVSIFSESLR